MHKVRMVAGRTPAAHGKTPAVRVPYPLFTHTQEPAMRFGVLIIGDEILSGRRKDGHLAKVIELLSARGLRLAWARYAGDEPRALTDTLRQTFAGGDTVFSFGGIGATPDDNTRQSAAAALGRGLELHPEAEALIRGRFGAETTPQRLDMGRFPAGARILPNPYNQIPGFAIERHYFVPGFPVMSWPMVETVLDTEFAHLAHRDDYVEDSIHIEGGHEGQFIVFMRDLTARYPAATLFSLPTVASSSAPRSLELGMKGRKADVAAAMAEIRAETERLGLPYRQG